MAKIINSQALEPANKALGIAGSGDSQTELLDGSVDQVLDVGQIARRGGTLAGTTGLFRMILRNRHGAAGVVGTSFQPYSPATTGLIAPYPTPVPDSFDFWLLGASIEVVAGAFTLLGADLKITQTIQGFGINEVTAAVVSNSVFTVANWDGLQTWAAPQPYALEGGANPFQKINLRIPRKGVIASPFIVFNSESDGLVDFDCVMLCGLFPVALGQDIAV